MTILKMQLILLISLGSVLLLPGSVLAAGYHEMPHIVEACKKQDMKTLRNQVAPEDNEGWKYQARALGLSEESYIHNKITEMCGYALAKDPEKYWEEQGKLRDREYIKKSKSTAILYKNIYCKSGWNDNCTHTVKLLAPDGWQVCNKSYSIVSERGHNKYIFTPILWYEGDTEHPDRFRGYKLYLESSGSGNPLNQEGANIELRNVSLTVIPARATNDLRYELGCEMPKRAGSGNGGSYPLPDSTPGPFPKEKTK